MDLPLLLSISLASRVSTDGPGSSDQSKNRREVSPFDLGFQSVPLPRFWSLLGSKDGCVRVRLRAASTLSRLRRLQTTRPAVEPALKVAAPTITSTAIGHSTSSHGCHPTLCPCVSLGIHLDCPRLMICPNATLQASKAERPTITTGTGPCLESLVLRDTQRSH
jgi:hypothetical protein